MTIKTFLIKYWGNTLGIAVNKNLSSVVCNYCSDFLNIYVLAVTPWGRMTCIHEGICNALI